MFHEYSINPSKTFSSEWSVSTTNHQLWKRSPPRIDSVSMPVYAVLKSCWGFGSMKQNCFLFHQEKKNQYSSPRHWINILYSHLIKTTSRNYRGLDLSQANKLTVFHLGLYHSTVTPLLKIHTLSNRTGEGGGWTWRTVWHKGREPQSKTNQSKKTKSKIPTSTWGTCRNPAGYSTTL